MNNLVIPKKIDEPYIPEVSFNAQTGVCEIAGESYMEEPNTFYSPLIEWIDEYCKNKTGRLVLNIKLSYFNTSSSKMILVILDMLRAYSENNGSIEANWYFDLDDEDMIEEIDDFSTDSGVTINKKSAS